MSPSTDTYSATILIIHLSFKLFFKATQSLIVQFCSFSLFFVTVNFMSLDFGPLIGQNKKLNLILSVNFLNKSLIEKIISS